MEKSKPISGFTLVELLVVVAIISLLVAVAIPQYRRFRVQALNAEPILLLGSLHKIQLSYVSSFDQFYPPDTSAGTGSNIQPSQILQFFQLPGETQGGVTKTKLGWRFNNLHYFGTKVGSQSGTVGYWMTFNMELDDSSDGILQSWMIQVPPNNYDSLLSAHPCPVGIPFLLRNDLTNQWNPCVGPSSY